VRFWFIGKKEWAMQNISVKLETATLLFAMRGVDHFQWTEAAL
jgi:hypothetical protein